MSSTASAKRTWPSKKTKKGETMKEIVFDDDARREYLTGFRKRNLAKKEARATRAKQKQKQEQLELRREKRKDFAHRAAENYAAVERAYKGSNLSDVDPDPEAGPSSLVAEPQELEFENEEQLATVTVVEDFEVDLLGEHKLSKPVPTGSASDSGSRSEGELSSGPAVRTTAPLKASTTSAPRSQLTTSSSSGLKSAKGASTLSQNKPTTKKRPAYQSKAERKLDKLKQKARRAEKMGEGKLRRKTNAGSKVKKPKGGRGKR